MPPAIGQLSALTRLFLNKNRLTALPTTVGQLTNLVTWYVSKQANTPTTLLTRNDSIVQLDPDTNCLVCAIEIRNGDEIDA